MGVNSLHGPRERDEIIGIRLDVSMAGLGVAWMIQEIELRIAELGETIKEK